MKLERGCLRLPRPVAETGNVQRALSDDEQRRTRLATTGTTLWLD